MELQSNTYSILHFGATLMSLIVAYLAWKRRSAPGGTWLFMVMLAAALWSFSDGMDLSSRSLEAHVSWAKISYLGAGTVSVFLLASVLEYTHHNRRLGRKRIAALLVTPLLIFAATLFNEWHGLTWTGFVASETDPGIIVYQHGPLFWLLVLYSFSLLFLTTIIIVSFARKAGAVYRRQSALIVMAILFPWAAMILYITTPGRMPGFNPSIVLVMSGTLLTFAIVRHRLFDLVPIAREALVEKMSDGLLALDSDGRIVDLNPATQHLLGLDAAEPTGEHIGSLLGAWPEAASRLGTLDEHDIEFTLESAAGSHLGFEASSLEDSSGTHQGNLVIVRDVTERVRAEDALSRANEELQEQVASIEALHAELSEQAIRDPLTALFNRRYLEEILGHEIGRASREGYPVSFIMLDIDGFKRINDVYGHATGDLILRYLGSTLRSQARAGDIACRYGGDEFLLVLTNTDSLTAVLRAEQWRVSFEEASTDVFRLNETATISFGVSTYPIHGETIEQVFAAADRAMYAAKAAGRNRVIVSPT